MPNLPRDQLQEWYARLKTALYEQVNVDLNHREDLGRIRIMRINDLHYEDPERGPDVDVIYPFIPHRPLNPGEQSTDPLLSCHRYEPPAPDKADTEAYSRWLLENLETNPSDDLIQELYDMAAEGQLVVQDGTSDPALHQIQNLNGQIIITDRLDNIQFEPIPDSVAPPQDDSPALPPRPAEHPDPGDPPKGFWIRLGHFFHIHTRYTDYVNMKAAYDESRRAITEWENVCSQQIADWESSQQTETTYLQRMESLRQQTEAFNQYIDAFSRYFVNPLNRFNIAFGYTFHKISRLDNEEQTLLHQREAEDIFWDVQHKNTPLGKMQTSMDFASDLHTAMNNTKTSVETMFAPLYKTPRPLLSNGILRQKENVPQYALPVSNDVTISNNDAAWICAAFLADPTVLELNPEDAQMNELGSDARYREITDALLFTGKMYSDPLFDYVLAARSEGVKTMQEYAQGNPDRLATTLGLCIRRQNALTPSFQPDDPYILNSFAVTVGVLAVLDAHPDLMSRCNLAPEEIHQARVNAALYHINEVGQQAKAELLGHALNQKTLSPEELRTAAADLLFMNTMNAQAAKNQDILLAPEEIQKAKQALMNQESVNQLLKLNRSELGKAIALPQEQLAHMPQVNQVNQANPSIQKAPAEKAIQPPQNQPVVSAPSHS